MVYRIFVEKKPGLDHAARSLCRAIQEELLIDGLQRVRIFNRYDLDRIEEALFAESVSKILSEPQLDDVYHKLPGEDAAVFGVEYIPGQYDQRADSAGQCIQILSQGVRPIVKTATIYMLYGNIEQADLERIKNYVINPVEAREASMELPDSLDILYDLPTEVEMIQGFIGFTKEECAKFLQEKGLAMDLEDLSFCQAYFQKEGRDPSITEIRMIDTYWSDHCRHTTFLTNIDAVHFEDPRTEEAWKNYLKVREELGRTKPINLMDIATISVKKLKKEGLLDRLDESEEINACTVKITVDVDGKPEDWLLLFKNETHNHPTEIEPFGGAATCIGGAIRDPLSGRSYVYAAMRVTGAADPTVALSETLPGKLSQKKLVTTAANGYSSYGNQIGLATGLVDEIYHPGYMAKRMEIGAVIAATPQENVRREVPAAGDLVILLGGRTGRDGCGGATGSSKAHKTESIRTCGAEVQKGNAPEERKLQRLFRNTEAMRMIKRCNDFGAGGVSVAIGELADGLEIDLNRVPKKYEGLDGTEIAISESQERMAVVIEKENLSAFLALAHKENLEATHVATVTEESRLRMLWNGKAIVDISREFLNSNGAAKHIEIKVEAPEPIFKEKKKDADFAKAMTELAGDLNVCSKRGLSERFDSTIGAGTVLMPFGGKFQRTPIQAMVHKISLEKGYTETVSMMAYGYNPWISEANPFTGAYLAVVESVAKLVAAGAGTKEIYLTLQEYFEKPGKEARRWGKPLAALLGAFSAQLDLGIAAIGGKDSMSGSFENLDVPPTLVSFAVTTDKISRIKSPEYKQAGNSIYLLMPKIEEEIPSTDSLKAVFDFIQKHNSIWDSLYALGYYGIAEAVLKQCMGNGWGFHFSEEFRAEELFLPMIGGFLAELSEADAGIFNETAGFAVRYLGKITEEAKISLGSESVLLSDLEDVYEEKLEKVFVCNAAGKADDADVETFSHMAKTYSAPAIKSAKPKMIIPVFPGTNCEYDSARAALRAGLDAEIIVIRNLSAKDITESVEYVADRIRESQIVFLPGGFSGGDEPDGSAKFIVSFFRNARVCDAVTELLEKRDGLMAGICNGFQALVKLGLLPFGRITDTDASCPSLTFNTINRHQSKIVYTRIASNNGPWLQNTEVGDIYAVPISHGEGRFLWTKERAMELAASGQIATQYVDASGRATMDIQFNPNGSLLAIEGLTSADGRIFGKMGHSERIDDGLYQNVPGRYDIGMFAGAKRYFTV